MTEEGKLRKKVIDFYKNNPDVLIIPKHQDMFTSQTGVSDLLLCVAGQFVAIELKVGKNQPTELQKRFIKQVGKAGGVGSVCRSLEEVQNILQFVIYNI